MEENKENAPKKLTYEELNNAATQLVEQMRQLKTQNQQLEAALANANRALMFRRLDYLFKVLEFAGVIKDPDFIVACTDEIKAALTPQEEQENKEE